VSPVEVATVVWRKASGEWQLSVVCKATFDLSPPVMRLSGYQAPIVAQDQRQRDTDSLFCASDLDPLKKRVDVTLVGHCFAPERSRVTSVVTRLKVGSIDKRIEVVGARTWKGGKLTPGEPFDRASVGYESSAGGQSTSNPSGIPATSTKIPMLQPPGGGPKRPGDRVPPIGFGPVAPDWPQRKASLRRHPGWSVAELAGGPLPPDIDERFFNSAPVDQQLDQILPDEALLLENLHPRYPRLETRLPGLSPHAFVDRPGVDPASLPMRLDTLWIDTDRSLCVVLWRAQVPIESPSEQGTVVVALGRAKDSISFDELRAGSGAKRRRSGPPPPPPPPPQPQPQPPPPRRRRSKSSAAPAAPPEPANSDDDLFANTETLTGREAEEAELASTAEVPAGGLPGPSVHGTSSHRPPPPPPPEAIRDEKTEPPPPASTRAEDMDPPPSSMMAEDVASIRERHVAETETGGHTSTHDPFTMTDSLGEGTDVLDASPAWLSRVSAGATAEPPPIVPPVSRPDSLRGLPFAPSSQDGPPSSSRGAPASSAAPLSASPPLPAQPEPVTAPVHLEPSPVSSAVQAGAALASHGSPVAAGIDRFGMVSGSMVSGSGVDRGYLGHTSAATMQHVPSAAAPTAGFVPSPLAPADVPAPLHATPPMEVGEVTELLWFDSAVGPRLRSRWASLVDDLEFSPEDPQHDLLSDDPQEARDHHNTFGVLTRALADDGPGIASAMKGAVGQGGRFTPPLVLVVGTMLLPFSELEMLKATSESMAPLAPSDKKLKELLDEVKELLNTPLLKGGASVATSLTRQLRAQFAETKRSGQVENLDAAIERVLLEERRYQMRKVFGGTSIRALVTVPGDSAPIPAYVPEDVGPKLPLANEMRIRAIAEAHMRQDRDEKRKIALRVLALGRVNRLD